MSKQVIHFLYLITLMVLVVSACAPKSPSPATEAPTTDEPAEASLTDAPETAEPPPLVTVTATEANPPSAPTLVTFDLSAPPMEVGSTFTFIDGSVLVAVPEGEFIMGHGGDDNPEHKVFISDFWIYRTEVSNRTFALCVALGQCDSPDPDLNPYFDSARNPAFRDPSHANDPVVGVTWEQANAYCNMVKGRLPTEAEWEKTARGPDGNIYPWGNAAPGCTLANIGRCNPGVVEVNQFAEGRSYYEALNLTGNVFEWVADWYDPSYYSISPTEDPSGPESGFFRAVRSGGFREDYYLAESARRFRFKPVDERDDLGFRCVVEPENLLGFAPWCSMVAYVGANQGGGAPGDVSIPSPVCDNVSGSSAGYCNTNTNPKSPAASLNFSPDPLPASSVFSVPGGCALDLISADPNDYYCTSGGTATVQGFCAVPPAPVPPGCPAGYTQNGNMCEWTGGGTDATACLPGVTYDPLTQCCSSTDGIGDSFALCPANAPYYAGGACVPWPSSDWGPLVTINVILGSCRDGGGGGNACQPPVGGCSDPKSSWDQDQCCCYNPFIGSCTK